MPMTTLTGTPSPALSMTAWAAPASELAAFSSGLLPAFERCRSEEALVSCALASCVLRLAISARAAVSSAVTSELGPVLAAVASLAGALSGLTALATDVRPTAAAAPATASVARVEMEGVSGSSVREEARGEGDFVLDSDALAGG